MLIYTPTITSRHRYICEFCGNELLGKPFELTADKETFSRYEGPVLNYSNEKIIGKELHIQPLGLLEETGIRAWNISCEQKQEYPIFFSGAGDMGFDIFSAIFYLLSRYEEYLPHQKDSYGRYAHENSLAFRNGFLEQPVINQWLRSFGQLIQNRFPGVRLRDTGFIFQPTYDIDIAWSYRNKGWWRNAGGFIGSFFKGDWKGLGQRIRVIRGKEKDPYDAYGWMNQLHEKNNVRPYYFFLLTSGTGKYDKNIPPDHPAMKTLIADHLIRYPVGVHPSWQSGDDENRLSAEIKSLQTITGSPVKASRQHYIRFNLPEGFRRLIANGIEFDFSMGYGSINGFRASVASPFYWYDLGKEARTNLLLFPFCYMEANSFYEQRFDAEQALKEMRHYHTVIRKNGGILITIWHNSFLGTDERFKGWREVYEVFVKEVAGTK